MRKTMLTGLLIAIATALHGCGGDRDQNQANATNVEEMGASGGSNTALTPPGSADNAPVGSVDNGNVLPGDANPNNPREGQEMSNGQ